MFLPIGDEPNPPGRPLVTLALIGVNVAVFLLVSQPLMSQLASPNDPATLAYLRDVSYRAGIPMEVLRRSVSAYDVFVYSYGFRPASPQLHTLFSSMFLHGGFMHLAGNMLFLWIFGDNVEHHLGRLRFFIVYLATGICATLFFAVFAMSSNTPLVGASGAISGVLGCYFLWFPHNHVRVLIIFIFIQVISIPARWVLGFYLLIDNLLPFMQGRGGSVAHGAHIGGFLAGLAGVKLIDRMQAKARIHRTTVGRRGAAGFAQALEAERWEEALKHFADLSAERREQISDWDVFSLADGLTRISRYDAGLAVLQRFISTHQGSPQLSVAHLRAGLINLHGLHRVPAAYQHLLTALDLKPRSEVASAARAALAEIEPTMTQPNS